MSTSADGKIISRLFFSLLPVQILMVAIGSIDSIIDGTIASNLIGPQAMAVIGLYMPVLKISETINAVMLGGSQILCGQFLGKNQIERTRSVFSLDMTVVVGVSLIMTGICFIAPAVVAHLLHANADTMDGLVQYILGMAAGLMPQMMGVQLTAYLQMEQQQKRTYVGIAAMMVVNAVLDIVFIKILAWGMLGLGLATTISCWVFFLILASYYFAGKAMIKFDRHGILWSDLVPVLKIGIPGALVTFSLAVRGITINASLIHYSGSVGVAALSALNTFGALLYAVTAGLAAATRLLISIFYGEEDRAGMVLVMKTALYKGVPLVCAVSALVFLLAGPMTSIFFKDPSSEVYYLTKCLFRIFPFSMPLSAICVIFINYYQSCIRMKIVNILSVTDGVAGVLVSCLFLAPLYGAMGVWVAHVLNGVYTTAIIIAYAWIVRRKMPHSVEDLMTLSDNFGVPEDSRLDITLHDEAEVIDTSKRVIDFCREKGITEKRAHYAGLCLEEMASNIVEHGFTDGKKHTIDVRVVYKEEELVLRITDNCRAFDPQEKLALIDPDDITKNIGLRMVSRISRRMLYSNMLGLNVLTITI